jgi:hypothetical protein
MPEVWRLALQSRNRRWLLLLVILIPAAVVLLDSDGFATTPVALPASTTLPPLPEVELSEQGFGFVAFGQPIETVLAEASELFGAPVESIDQPCGDQAGRWIRWGNLSALGREGVFVGFISGIYYPEDAPPIGVRTTEGLSLGASAQELQDLYEDRVAFADPEEGFEGSEIRSFGIDGYLLGQSSEGIGGYLEGDPETGTVITIVGGDLCSFPPKA